MAGVFISYRRADSAGWTGRIYDRLTDRLGPDRVFVDVETIRPGQDFTAAIKETLSRVDGLVVVIGPGWLDSLDDEGRRRLDDPSDVVRKEIALALDRDIRTVPILVDGARMPDGRRLPAEIRRLADLNAMSLDGDRFDHDIQRLLTALDYDLTGEGRQVKPSHNLPIQVTSFVGRDEDLEEVKRLLDASRLVTLFGVGGSGKTRLALQTAEQVLGSYEDGVWLAQLGPISDPSQVVTTITDVLGITAAAGEDHLEMLSAWLATRRVLLVLDNCEHLIDATAQLSARILSRSSDVTILATSRELLRVPGERSYQVPPLEWPQNSDEAPGSDLTRYSAVRLFVERARAAQPDWSLTAENADVLVQICSRLDGLPLAIELAAARLRMMSISQIADRLDDRFALLGGGSRTGLPRHQTLEATIEWSFTLLPEDERVLFRRLAVFRGSFTLEAVGTVCGVEPLTQFKVVDLLSHLVDKSLVNVESRGDGVRYRMLETLHRYARDRFAETDEVEQISRRHANYLLELAAEAQPNLRGHVEEHWLRRLDDELDNLRQAMAWALETSQPELAQALVGSLYRYFADRDRFEEGRDWAERAAALSERPTVARARTLLVAGSFFRLAGEDLGVSGEYLDRAIQLARYLGEYDTLRRALNSRAMIANHQGDWERAHDLYQESVELARRDNHRDSVVFGSLMGLVECATVNADYPLAVSLAQEAVEIARELGSERQLSDATTGLVMAYRDAGDLDAAEANLSRIFRREDKLGVDFSPGWKEFLSTRIALDRGNQAEASQWFRRSLAVRRVLPNARVIPGDLRLGAELLAGQYRLETAASLMGAADAAMDEIGAVRWPKSEAEAAELRDRLSEHLGDSAFESAYQEGRGWDAEERTDHLAAAINELI